LRPNVVWFGEIPFGMERIYQALEDCDLFVTSAAPARWHPAAGFVSHLRQTRGGLVLCVYVGLERPENAYAFDECRWGRPASFSRRCSTSRRGHHEMVSRA